MKTLIVTAAAAAVMAGAPFVANAQDMSPKGYASLGYSQGDYDGGADLGTVQGRIGARFGQYLGVEGELGLGAKSDDTWVGGLKADNSVKHQAGVYGVGFLPVGENADLYARVGYGDTKVKTKLAGVPDSDRNQSWNYGVGGQYFFDGKNGVRADYTRHEFLHSDDKADVVSLGYVHQF
ncbi:MAG: porin family protein [Phenylobacterium sp.]|uniref:porin family protein n=1 Tax=Phenylobacterium sp. TaxID=1871053 RepID=UPI00391AFB41